jgi:hypothetical protein
LQVLVIAVAKMMPPSPSLSRVGILDLSRREGNRVSPGKRIEMTKR